MGRLDMNQCQHGVLLFLGLETRWGTFELKCMGVSVVGGGFWAQGEGAVVEMC